MTYDEMVVDSVRFEIDDTSRAAVLEEADTQHADIDDKNIRSWAVVLKEPVSDHMLPITIGRAEAEAIIFKLQELPIPRPMSHDLMVSLATAFGAAIQEVRVTKWEQETFFAAVVVARDGQTEEIDARPSDAIALALRAQVPIYVHTAVREQTLVKPTSATPNSTTQVLVMSNRPSQEDAG